MTLIRSLSVAAVLVAATSLCAAQGTASSASAVSPAKKELALKVVQLQQSAIENAGRQLAEQSIAPLVQQIGMLLQTRVPPEQREALAKDIQGDIRKYGDETVPLLRERALKLGPTTIGPLLEEKLSEDELKQVIAMLEAPIYRKYHALSPDMQRVLQEKLVAETRATIEPKLQALQETIGKRLNPAGAASAPTGTKPAGPRASASAPKAAASSPKK
ncbi:hypothetical protein [Aquabacterium sp.]|uniref:hypothetical protein n=1 Tax=Aquabacterium sp. TaxID=1872578 RepID=UPI002B73186A|nr:hypothetical protein [Aquabacterium sp.]HSW08070.1 hypothetical protein [Aquabacterium sp.]